MNSTKTLKMVHIKKKKKIVQNQDVEGILNVVAY